MQQSRTFLVIASIFGLTGVALGSFGAHCLKSTISSDLLLAFEMGVRYQMYHTFALYVVSWFLHSRHTKKLVLSAWFFVSGVILFSGSLYLLAITGLRSFGMITPLGGMLLLAGWVMLMLGFLDKKSIQ